MATQNHWPGPRVSNARRTEGLPDVDCPVVLVGDFNDGGDTPARVLGVRDAWLEVRGTDTPTFDPGANPLAAVSSLSGRASRLDRVFLRGDGVRCAGGTTRAWTGGRRT